MIIVDPDKLLKLSSGELRLLLSLIKHISNDNEYSLNAKVKQDVSKAIGLKDQSIRQANSELVKAGVVIMVKSGWYRLNEDIMRKN